MPQPPRDDVYAKLQAELDVTDWRALRPHAGRDSLILVAPELDLVEVAWCVARDDSVPVADWIRSGKLRKPAAAEMALWERDLDTPFRLLIVTPYVLLQTV